MIEIIPSKQTKIIDIMSKKIKPKDEKVSTVVGKLLNDVCMALNQASNPSKLMHTSSIPILRILLKNLEKRKYLLRVFMCKGSILNLNFADKPDLGDAICNMYTTEDGVCRPFNVGPGIYFVQIDTLDAAVSTTPVAQRLVVIRDDSPVDLDKQIYSLVV